jgi:thioredoxin-like negative regulator of GroEL
MKCFDEAEELGKRVLDARVEALGDNHPETLVSMSNLAMVYNSQGRREEAGDLMAEVIRRQSSSRQLGENHPSTLINIYNLALIRLLLDFS